MPGVDRRVGVKPATALPSATIESPPLDPPLDGVAAVTEKKKRHEKER